MRVNFNPTKKTKKLARVKQHEKPKRKWTLGAMVTRQGATREHSDKERFSRMVKLRALCMAEKEFRLVKIFLKAMFCLWLTQSLRQVCRYSKHVRSVLWKRKNAKNKSIGGWQPLPLPNTCCLLHIHLSTARHEHKKVDQCRGYAAVQTALSERASSHIVPL